MRRLLNLLSVPCDPVATLVVPPPSPSYLYATPAFYEGIALLSTAFNSRALGRGFQPASSYFIVKLSFSGQLISES
jgi:hypothetical protein